MACYVNHEKVYPPLVEIVQEKFIDSITSEKIVPVIWSAWILVIFEIAENH